MKFKVIYSASDDEHAPDWRDDGILIEARSAEDAYIIANQDITILSQIKGSDYQIIKEDEE